MNLAPVIPLKRDDQNGYAMMTDVKRLVAFHLKNLLLTSKGEKISDPDYGVGLKRYLFEPMMPGVYSVLKNEISSQIFSYLPYVKLVGVQVLEDADNNSLSIRIEYKIGNSRTNETLKIESDGSSSTPTANAFS
jgi:phage baseplate assembly protein W